MPRLFRSRASSSIRRVPSTVVRMVSTGCSTMARLAVWLAA